MESVNVGIIGCGTFSSTHIRFLSRFPDVRLMAVCSRNKANAEKSVQLIRELGKNQGHEEIFVYTDYHEMVVPLWTLSRCAHLRPPMLSP